MSPTIIKEKIGDKEKAELVKELDDFAKVAVDISKEILSIGCELHIDCYEQLIEAGSAPENLWGANVYLKSEEIEYTSMVNIRPPINTAVEIKDAGIRAKIKSIIQKLLF